ncbi:prefoldin subunit alpha [Candidatus Bathyarchaeota archaeon]|nr:prefoldin subunit alpha [Candidatus Bathyarchaeota archaeon]RJS89913.1 MAG: prefoldin subunit alpha [Candidatus Bathyarchaeota archaeon]RLI33396.1 MAG: prefoldin subunit alpha [Candidatus Bathyarchaeota archaeon]
MSAPRSKEDQLRRLLVELQILQNTAEVLQSRLNVLESAMAELRVAGTTLRELGKEEEGAPLLIPVGGGSFIKARLGDISKVIVGIGADVSVEMELEKALEDIGARLSEMEKASRSIQQQLSQIVAQIRDHQESVNRLSQELRGEGASGVQ